MVKIIKIFLFFPLLAAIATAEAAKYKGEVFTLFSDARSLSMGETGVSYAQGINSIYWNPATLEFVNNGFSVGHSEYYEGLVRVEHFAMVRQKGFKDIPLGLMLNYIHSKPVELTSLEDETLGVEEGNIKVTGSAAYSFVSLYLSGSFHITGNLMAGINLKFSRENLYSMKEIGVGVDAAFYTEQDLLSYGFVIRDIIFSPFKKDTGYESVYPSFWLGCSARLKRSRIVAEMEIHTDGKYEGAILSYRDFSGDVHIGMEYLLSRNISLRGGFSRGRITAGAGLNFSRFSVDYAIYPHTDLGLNHKITLTLWY